MTCFRDLWPDTLDSGSNEDSNDKKLVIDNSVTKGSVKSSSKPNELTNKILPKSENNVNGKVITSSDKVKNDKGNDAQSLEGVDKEKSATKGKPSQLKTSDSKEISNLSSKESGYEQPNAVGTELQNFFPTADQPLNFGPQPQPLNFVQSYPLAGPTMLNPPGQGPLMEGPAVAGVPFGYQPFSVPNLAFQEMPLVFGPQPPPVFYYPMQPADMSMLPSSGPEQIPEKISETTALNSKANAPKKTDLREELAKKRQAESKNKGTPDRKVYDMTPERTVINTDERKEGWSRQVYVSDTEGGKEKISDDLREKLRQKDTSKEKRQNWSQEKKFPPGRSGKRSRERNQQRISPNRMSPERQRRRFSPGGPRRFSPGRRTFSPGPRRFSPGRNMRFSAERDSRRISPERGRPRNISREESWPHEERIVRERNSPHERRFPRDLSRNSNFRNRRSFSRSPRRSPSPFSKYIVYANSLNIF